MTTRIVNCPECGGSGVRMGCAREIECFDCGGEGQWKVEDDADPLTDQVEHELRFTIEQQRRVG
jgi:DnaJ-class molecular chaperone